MKRLFLILVAVCMTVAVWPVGSGTENDPIEYDWATGELDAVAGQEVWYHIDLTPVLQMDVPVLSLTFRNPSSVKCTLQLHVELLGQQENRTYYIEPNGKKTWSQNLSLLKGYNAADLNMKLWINCSANIEGDAEVFEEEDVSDICMEAVRFNMSGQNVAASVLQWYEVDLTSARAQDDKIFVLKYTNSAASPVRLTRGLSPECPTTGVTERVLEIPANTTVKDTIFRSTLDILPNFAFLSIEANGAVNVSAQLDDKPLGVVNPHSQSYKLVKIGETISNVRAVSSPKYFMVKKKELLQYRHQPRINFLSQNEDYSVSVDIFFSNDANLPEVDYSHYSITVPAGEVGQMVFPMNMVQQLDTTDGQEFVFARVRSTKSFSFVLDMPHIREKDYCKYAADFDWGEAGNFQNALDTKWYAVDLTEAKRDMKDIELWIVNRGTVRTEVNAEVTFVCPYMGDAESMTRTVMPGDTLRKVIKYGSYSMFKNDTVWVGLTVDQPVWFGAKQHTIELKEPDGACLTATDFSWKNGHSQAANDTVWYRVALDTLRNTKLLPSVVINNLSNSAMTIWAELSIDCPDSIPNEARSLSIRPAGIYSREISREMVNRFDPDLDYVYIRLVANQDFSFRLELEKPDQGSSCQDAFDFNWVIGNDQIADTAVWYAIDLREAKAAVGKDVNVMIYNRSNHSGSITAELASTCPCESPQKQTLTLGAGQMRSKVLPHSSFGSFGDMVWVRLSSNVAIHFQAELVDAAPFTPIEACASATVLELGHEYEQQGDTVWFVMATDTLKHTVLVPQVVLVNGDTKQTIKAEVAYTCPVMESMMSRSVVMGAGASEEKKIERSMCESIANQHDSVWIRLTGASDYRFRVDLVDPNTGDDCAHAQLLNVNQTVVQAAGTTAWYRVEMEQLRKPNHVVEAIVGNMDGQSGSVTVSFYTGCGGEMLRSQSAKLAANGVMSKSLSSAFASAVAGDWVYLKVFTQRQDSIRFVVEPDSPIDPITACEDALELFPNTTYTLEANTDSWFMVDVRALRENYSGDGLLHVINLNETETAEVDAWVAWACPVTYEMEHRHIRILQDDEYLKTASRSLIEGLRNDTVYVRLYSSQRLQLQAEFILSQGTSCSEAIPFDWNSYNPYYAEQTMWYALHLDSAAIGDHELYLHAENMGGKSTSSFVMLYDSCGTTTPKMRWSNSIAENETLHHLILRDSLQTWGWWPDTTLYLSVLSFENMRLWIDTVPAHLTIDSDTICNGDSLIWRGKTLKETGEYRDTLYNIYGGEQIFVMNLTVGQTYLVPTVDTICQGTLFEWQGKLFADSLPGTYELIDSFKTVTFGCDSIYTLKLTINPTTPNDTISQIICQGDTVVWGKFNPTKYYESGVYVDSLVNRFGCDSVVWLNLTVVDTTDVTISLSDCDSVWVEAKQQWFYEDAAWVDTVRSPEGCESYTRYVVTVNYSYPRAVTDTTICAGVAFEWNDSLYIKPGIYNKKFKTVAGCDSVAYLNLRNYPTYKDTVRAQICEGESYSFAGRTFTQTSKFTIDTVSQYGCDSIVTLLLTVLAESHDTIDFDACDSIFANGRWRYSNYEYTTWDLADAACNSTITYRYHVHHSYLIDTVASVKEGDVFVWRGRGLTKDTVVYDPFTTKFGCDSIYRLKLYVLPGSSESYTYNFCEGETAILVEPNTDTMRYYYTSTVVIDTMPYPAPGGGPLVRAINLIFHPTYHVDESPITIREGQIASWKMYRLGDIPAKSKTEVTVVDTCAYFTSYKWNCDSVRCVRINILPRTYGDEWVDICDGESFTYTYELAHRWYTKTFDKEGHYPVTLDNFLGGDSILTIHVRVHPNVNRVDSVTLSVGGTYTVKNPVTGQDTVFYATTPGVSTHLLYQGQSQYGCDSTYTVRMVVFNPAEGFENIYGEDGEHVVQKVIYQNHLYMIVDDRRYDALGRRVK